MDDDRLGLYDGRKFVFEESNWSIVSTIRMLYRYGWDLVRLERYIQAMLKEFAT